MKPLEKFTDSLYIAWAIARKDIGEAFKNKNTRSNIVVLLGLIVFFYWMSTPRPFDKRINVVVYDEGNTSLTIEDTKLEDGTEFIFYEASSLEDMKRKMAYKELGLVLPVDFDQILEAGGEPTLSRRGDKFFSFPHALHASVDVGIDCPAFDDGGKENKNHGSVIGLPRHLSTGDYGEGHGGIFLHRFGWRTVFRPQRRLCC
jgi:hypothetical protein